MKYVLSLGAGVQSSTVALMAATRFETNFISVPMPDFAVFADTQAEPSSVYTWLDWLETQVPFPVYRITHGSLAAQEMVLRRSARSGKLYRDGTVPVYAAPDEKHDGSAMSQRRCTVKFKIDPIRKFIKEQVGDEPVVQLLGISYDEAHRMKDSMVPWMTNSYPLVEMRYRRDNCLNWMRERDYPQPPRSACVFCPYRSDREWLALKEHEPEEFARAVQFERDVRAIAAQSEATFTNVYLHRKLIPLDQVDFDPNANQPNLFGNDCAGMCGV